MCLLDEVTSSLIVTFIAHTADDKIYLCKIKKSFFQTKGFVKFKVLRANSADQGKAANYSGTSMARTLMARLPRLFRTRS